ncbi:MAG: aldo/keto reductase [Candidatus Latescibacter sp.]|nr:aldo/keto reductase [Candidatus Latescibacter sp.]
MENKEEKKMNRKEFFTRTTEGIIGIGLTGLAAPDSGETQAPKTNVEFRTLGKTGLKISAVGIGAARTNEPSVIKKCLDMGLNFFDTGRMYSEGKNEEIIGSVIKDIRKNMVIQSKIDQKLMGDREAMVKSIDDSLKALRTDFIDIMLVRGATSEEFVNDTILMEVFSKAKKSGKIRFCGFSSHAGSADQILRAGVKTKFYDVAMIPYNHAGHFTHSIYGIYSEWNQEAKEKEIADAVAAGMGILVMKTCSGGPRKEEGEPKETYRSALKWILRNKNVSSVVAGMGNFREVTEDTSAMG